MDSNSNGFLSIARAERVALVVALAAAVLAGTAKAEAPIWYTPCAVAAKSLAEGLIPTAGSGEC